MPRFTPTEERILAILSDGQPHSKKELMTALDDDLAAVGAIRIHVFRIKNKLKSIGQTILCEYSGYNGTTRYSYRHVRLLRKD